VHKQAIVMRAHMANVCSDRFVIECPGRGGSADPPAVASTGVLCLRERSLLDKDVLPFVALAAA